MEEYVYGKLNIQKWRESYALIGGIKRTLEETDRQQIFNLTEKYSSF